MLIPTLENLPPKFLPFLIGSQSCPATIKDKIDNIFTKPLKNLKGNYIFDADDWVLKCDGREDMPSTPDTHLYRIRKAEKIRAYIHKNQLDNDIAVPEKYLYWNNEENKFYVVAKKMNLSSEVACPASWRIEKNWKDAAKKLNLSGQLKALENGVDKRSLTPIQAKALAKLSILGYTDVTYNNLYFTKDGKVAIIDTEPVKRYYKKTAFQFKFRLLVDKGSILAQQSIAGIAKLKLYTDNKDALKEVQKVERNYVLWNTAKLITKISIVTLAICFTSAATALIPIAALATTLKVGIIAALVLKDIFLALNLASMHLIWHFSCQGLEGVKELEQLERIGYI